MEGEALLLIKESVLLEDKTQPITTTDISVKVEPDSEPPQVDWWRAKPDC